MTAEPVEAAPDPDDEDTLSELDRVPAVSTMVVSAEEMQAALAQMAPAPQPAEPPRRRRRWLLIAVLVVLVLIAAAVAVWLLTS
jgi:ferric-dicitrate binding protein FerR (iron transport regulator)